MNHFNAIYPAFRQLYFFNLVLRYFFRPLHEAAENGFVEIIRLLLSYGADPRLATYAGLTPLSLATDEDTKYILKNFIADMEGRPTSSWIFKGPASCFGKYKD